MNDMVNSIEQKETGPCGGFTLMYDCMCEYHDCHIGMKWLGYYLCSGLLPLMLHMVNSIEQKETGPYGGFTLMYDCMCEYHELPYRDEVAWVRTYVVGYYD